MTVVGLADPQCDRIAEDAEDNRPPARGRRGGVEEQGRMGHDDQVDALSYRLVDSGRERARVPEVDSLQGVITAPSVN